MATCCVVLPVLVNVRGDFINPPEFIIWLATGVFDLLGTAEQGCTLREVIAVRGTPSTPGLIAAPRLRSCCRVLLPLVT